MKAFIFDMDGLLVDSEKLSLSSWHKAAEIYGVSSDDIDSLFQELMGANAASRKESFDKKFKNRFDFTEFEDKVKEISRNTEKASPVPLKKGVKELLTYLSESGYKIGLASSSRAETISRRTRLHAIDIFFDVMISGESIKNSKPDPEIFLICAKKLGTDPKNCTVFEDSANGIKAAYAANMRPVLIPDLYKPTEEIKPLLYAIYPSLLDVKNALENGTF